MIGIIGAMALEIDALAERMQIRERIRAGQDDFRVGELFGQEAVLADCGPGKVNAALTAQQMILRWQPEWILNIGVAGGADPDLRVGDIVVATDAVQHDMDTTGLGDPAGYVSKVGLVAFPCDDKLRRRLVRAASQLQDVRVVEGVIATGDQFVNDAAVARRLREQFGAAAVEMEGAAIAHACYVHRVPCGILRSISDGANQDSGMDFADFAAAAAAHAQRVVELLLTEGSV